MSQQRKCDRCPAPATRFTAIPVKIGGAVMYWTEHAYCAACDPFGQDHQPLVNVDSKAAESPGAGR